MGKGRKRHMIEHRPQTGKRQYEKPFHLNMTFNEAVERYAGVDVKQLPKPRWPKRDKKP